MREYVFAGSFYPANKRAIMDFIKDSVGNVEQSGVRQSDFISYVAPHAGYVYSGNVAAYTYNAISENGRLPRIETIVVVGPNHTGYGRPISVSMQDWKTPLGEIKNDFELSEAIVKSSDMIDADESAHASEHSIEVQLPFIQMVAPNKKFVAICMGDQSLEYCESLANAIMAAEKKLGRDVMVVASSDFNHYETAEVAKKKDLPLIEKLKVMDYAGFHSLVDELGDSACGFGPITVSLLCAKAHGATKGELLKYANSGDATGDYSSVVTYASIGFG